MRATLRVLQPTIEAEAEMSRMMMGPWGPMAFGGEETVTIGLDRYERLKAEPGKLAVEHKKALERAVIDGKLMLFCEVVQRDLQMQVPLNLLQMVEVKLSSNNQWVIVKITDRDTTNLLMHADYCIDNNGMVRRNRTAEPSWALNAYGAHFVVVDALGLLNEALERAKPKPLAAKLQTEIKRRRRAVKNPS